jgi:hypothetical protein
VWTVFHSWDRALVAAGFEPQGLSRWTPQAVIEALQRDARRRGRPPTMSEWETSPRPFRAGRRRPTSQTVKTVLGSWTAGLAAAGLTAQKTGGERWERCGRGHPLEGDNVGIGARGNRFCRTCRRARDREYQRRRRAEARAA